MGLVGRATIHAGAGSAPGREDIFPGHTQYFAGSGAVVSTSTKPDVMQATAGSRRQRRLDVPLRPERRGRMPTRRRTRRMVTFDIGVEMGCGGRHSRRHGPCKPYERHTCGAKATGTNEPARSFSTLLHAAAVADHSMRDVLRWIDRHDGAPALEILAHRAPRGPPPPICSPASWRRTLREQSGIWSTASGVLAAYRTEVRWSPPGTRSSTSMPSVTAPTPSTSVLRGAINGNSPRSSWPRLGDVRDAVYSVRRKAGRPPTLLALDEVANIAPVPDLPGHGERGWRAGFARAGVPPGPLPGTEPLGQGGRRLPLALRHDGGLPRHRRHQRRCATSARWPASTRWPRRRSPARPTAGA